VCTWPQSRKAGRWVLGGQRVCHGCISAGLQVVNRGWGEDWTGEGWVRREQFIVWSRPAMANHNKLLHEEETCKTGRASLYTASAILTLGRTRWDRTSRSSSRRKYKHLLTAQPEPSTPRNLNLHCIPRNPEPSLPCNPNLPPNPEPSLVSVVV
jgi:hypothetical protein